MTNTHTSVFIPTIIYKIKIKKNFIDEGAGKKKKEKHASGSLKLHCSPAFPSL